jgi:Abnormal spindle-like microcephaly-assoc'd, ASPM-SPD-2-Hydin/Thrombospondin type 3 repeat
MSNRWLGLLILVVSFASRGVALANVTASLNPFDLGSVAVGTPGSGSFTLTDSTSETATLVLGTGGTCGDFSLLSTTTPALSTTPTPVMVQLLPTSLGAKSCTITVTSSQPTVTVTVTGTGTGAPQISVAPAGHSLTFGDNEVGHASTASSVIATNTGNTPLTISSATFASGAANYTLTGTTTSQTVAPGLTAQWDIACKPQVQGAADGTFRIASNAPGNATVDVSLTCNGTRGFLTVDQATIAFGGVPLNGSATRTVTLTNTGNLPVSGITAVFDRPTAGYSIDPTTPVPPSLAVGEPVALKINFAPTKAGDGGNAKITFSGVWGVGGANSTTALVALTGELVDVGVTPSALDFGSFLFDSRPAQVFHIVNGGSSAVAFNAPTFVPDTGSTASEFIVTLVKNGAATVNLPASLPGGQQFDVTVSPAPNARVGTVSGHFLVHSTTSNIPDQMVAVTGNSTANTIAVADVDFDKVDVNDLAPQTKMATLTNTGAQPVHISAVTPTGASGPFTITPPALPVDLAPGAVLAITVTYKPTVAKAADAPDTTMFSIGVSGVIGMASATVMVKGRGIDRVFALGAAPVFPPTFRNPGSKASIVAVTVRNDGEAVLKVTGLMIAGDPVWTLVDAAPIDIAGKSSHDFMVRFAPTAIGAAPPGQLTIMSNDKLKMMAVVPLTGTAVARNVVFLPATIDVGYVGVGVPTPVGSLEVTNVDPATTFTIHAIELPDSAFRVDGASDVELLPSATQRFKLTFAPQVVGPFETTATLFLDEDPEQQAQVTITGQAVFVDAHGGGGCDAGGTRGTGGLVVGLAALLIARRRRRRGRAVPALFAALAALAWFASIPAARADGVDLAVFAPTPATTVTGFQLQSPEVGAHGSFAISSILSFASNPLVLESFDSTGTMISHAGLIERSSELQLGAAFAFLERFEVGARLPIYTQSGENGDPRKGIATPAAHGTAVGNLALNGKVRLARVLGRPGAFVLGAGASVLIPTATDGQFTGADKPAVRLLALASFTPSALASRLAISINGGGVLRGKSAYANITQKSAIAWGVGASYRILDPLWATAEVFGEATPSGKGSRTMPAAQTLSPIEWLAGLRIQAGRQLAIGLAGGRGLNGALGTPEVRGVLTLSLVPRAAQLAPIHPLEVRGPDGDADGDGIPDSLDKCPNEPEDKDMFQDEDGCPDPDNDQDGIPDVVDKCPLDPEDKDGFQDEDGCPDKDNDGDGIPDDRDKCPNEPEDKDGFEDLDGCPDPDNDHDGIPDDKDKCPNEPETINGFQDEDGCPDKGASMILLSPDRIELLDPVQFAGTKLTRASFGLLGQVAATLRAHTEIARMRITVHVQPSQDTEADQVRSAKRAQVVRDWLVQWGIAPIRLEARGFGGTKPLVPPERRGAAKVNDRIELIILERK